MLLSSFHPFIQRWRINCYMHHIYNYLFCFCSHSMRKQPKERPAPNNLMVSFFSSLLHPPPGPNQPSRGLEHETWNANYSIDRVSEWVYLIVGRLLLGLRVKVCVKPWPFFFFRFLFENFIYPVLDTPLICTMHASSLTVRLLMWIL